MRPAQASRLDEKCVPASSLHSHAGNDSQATLRLRTGTMVRRVAGFGEGRASDAAVT